MRNLIVDEVRSFRDLVRQQTPATPVRKESHELPPAPSAQQQPGAGMGPAYSEELTEEVGAEEEPHSALERQLGQHRIA
jgi:mitogen-activated protein kinase 7